MANTIRDPKREAFWRRTLARHQGSGLNIRDFCRSEKLPETAFYFWRRTIRQRGPAQHESAGGGNKRRRPKQRRPKQRRPKRPNRKLPAFVPLVLGNVSPTAGITLELRGGRSLRLSEAFPVERLAALLRAVEAEDRP